MNQAERQGPWGSCEIGKGALNTYGPNIDPGRVPLSKRNIF